MINEAIQNTTSQVIISFLVHTLKVAKPSKTDENEVVISRRNIASINVDVTYGYISISFKNGSRLVFMKPFGTQSSLYKVKISQGSETVFDELYNGNIELLDLGSRVYLTVKGK